MAMIRLRVLGIDPGLGHMGWGVIDVAGSRLSHVAHGVIATPARLELANRLLILHSALIGVIVQYRPGTVSIEQAFVHKDAQAAMKIGQARAVAMLAAAQSELSIAEYAPNHIKKSVVGVGHAGKEQVQAMIRHLLPAAQVDSADAADALACAIAHAHLASSQMHVAARAR
jgi:crossover junction endodeoxyribonuclease RuvC